jgi:hypothetical protein
MVPIRTTILGQDSIYPEILLKYNEVKTPSKYLRAANKYLVHLLSPLEAKKGLLERRVSAIFELPPEGLAVKPDWKHEN